MNNNILHKDVLESLSYWRYWLKLGFLDIKNKYRRTFLGPLWVTGTVAVIIFAVGPLYGVIFNRPIDTYLLHLATGMTFWLFISSTISELCTAFIDNSNIIKNSSKPVHIFLFRIVSRNTLILLHNIIIPILIALYYGFLSTNIFFLIPAILILVLFLCVIALPISLLSTRFRDLIPLTQNILQLFFFLTPIFWVAGTEMERFSLLHLNPFDYFISLARMPFYSEYNSVTVYIIMIFILIFYVFSNYLFSKYSNKVSYWL
jgi:ABC-type polysaccharide/polyol phosphate export permease